MVRGFESGRVTRRWVLFLRRLCIREIFRACLPSSIPRLAKPFLGIQFHRAIFRASRPNTFRTSPRQTGQPATNRYVDEETSEDDDKGNIRVDYVRSEKDSIFGSYTIGNSPQTIAGFSPSSSRSNDLNGRNAALGWTHVFSPTLLNTFYIGLNRVFNDPFLPPPGSPNDIKTWGFQNVTTLPACNGLPGVALTRHSGGGPSSLCIFLLTNNLHFDDNLSWAKGRNWITTGFQLTHVRWRNFVNAPDLPQLSFTGQYSGNSVADYLLGIPYSASAQDITRVPVRTAYWPAIYFGDEIQVTAKFSVDVGLRWSTTRPRAENLHSLVTFDPAIPGGGLCMSRAQALATSE